MGNKPFDTCPEIGTLPRRKFRFNLIRKIHLLWYSVVVQILALFSRNISFQCNICGQENENKDGVVFDRELASCAFCGSNLRYRSIIDILSHYLFGESRILVDFPVDKSFTGLGASDWKGYADILSSKFSYVNTFFHKEPILDITNIPIKEYGKYDFVIISDVLEHIDFPVIRGIKNLHKLLKPNGICIITVPFMNYEKTLEHFPDLYQYQIVKREGKTLLVNRTKKGMEQTFSNLKFHGGGGDTLEKRIFTRKSLYDELSQAGFSNICFHRPHNLRFGIKWIVNWSLPVSAIKKEKKLKNEREMI